jgi:uncharacterized protein YndB with AHSA1/START domain/mannose-6-phosphate isomerase-like protein (cupin superfamily)
MSAKVLDLGPLGVRVELRDADGDVCEFDVVGRARGFLTAPHVHRSQTEHHQVIEGALRLVIGGREHVLGPGESMSVPAGVAHRQLPGGEGEGRVRVRIRPAGRTEQFLRRLEELITAGRINRFGLPSPLAAAELVRDFGHEDHPALPPLRVQRAIARALLRIASREYVFVDEWDVAAPREAVFAALADARTYPEWWRPVYLNVRADGAPAVGSVSHQEFKGRLPYHLHTRSRITRMEPPHSIAAEVDGDLRGTGLWTLTENPAGGTHVRFDWRVHADRPLLRALTPLLRPALRWNHAWAIARAVEGLEPYAQRMRT